MKKLHVLSLKKRYIFLIVGIVLVLYMIVAYNYFYFRIHSVKLAWPNNGHTYHLNGSSPSNKIYIALGDSLTYGFGADNYEASYTYQIANHLAAGGQGVTLKDFSYPGYRTNDLLETLDPAIASNPSIITLFIGVNDTHDLSRSGEFTKNYDQILYRLTHETKAKIYVINMPYLGAQSILLPPYNYFFDAKTRSHNDSIKLLAKKYNVDYIDLYSPTVELFKKNGPQYSKDLYHPSSQGYGIWADIIKNDIRQ